MGSGFGKKPLVAITLLVIIIMCLSLAEAAPRPVGNKIRHNRKYKADLLTRSNETGHKHLYKHTDIIHAGNQHSTMSRQNHKMSNSQTKQSKHKLKPNFKKALQIITRQLNNTLTKFNDTLVLFSKTLHLPEFEYPKAKFLPKVKFVDIHGNTTSTYDNIRSRFRYVMPKLLQNLNKHKKLFEMLQKVEVKYVDNRYYEEEEARKLFLNASLKQLNTLIKELAEQMKAVGMRTRFSVSRFITTDFEYDIDDTKCKMQDKISFENYKHAIKFWVKEVKCWSPRNRSRPFCIEYEQLIGHRRRHLGKNE